MEELLAAIGGGDIRLNQMVNFLQSQFNKPSAAEQDAAALEATAAENLYAANPQ